MIYLRRFSLLSDLEEHYILEAERRRIFTNTYPLHIFPEMGLETIRFGPITCFYGGNGSGKSTLLNIIASTLNATRLSPIDKGSFFEHYVARCNFDMAIDDPIEIKAITSDDVFDYLLSIRSINAGVNRCKEKLSAEYLSNKFSTEDTSFENYAKLKDLTEAKSKTMSRYVRDRLANNNLEEHSNGESALLFWEKEIKEQSIYILDEPENSLSAENQIKLAKFIEDSARFYDCQFIISTHSPFLLSMKDATIYDLDTHTDIPKKWTELANVRLYYDFFKEHDDEFDTR